MSEPDLDKIVDPSVDAPAEFPDLYNGNLDTIREYLCQVALEYAVTNQKTLNNADEIDEVRALVYSEVANITSSSVIGNPEDGTYTDGLFTDFQASTTIGTAIDRINEVLKAISPGAPDVLTSLEVPNGTEGQLSFGVDNEILGYENSTFSVNKLIDNSGNWRGIHTNTNISGVINPDVVATDNYVANAFMNGDQGTLQLVLNDVVIHSYDLSANPDFNGNSKNSNGSGFINMSKVKNVVNEGREVDALRYRTSEWKVNADDLQLGYNTIRVKHVGSWGEIETPKYKIIVDGEVITTTFAGASVSGFSGTGSKKVSGIEYFTGGTYTYGIDISNAYRNTFSTNPIFLNGTNIQTSNIDYVNLDTGSSEDELKVVNVSEAITIIPQTNDLIAGGSATTNVLPSRTVQTEVLSSNTSLTQLLIDSSTTEGGKLVEEFYDEKFRIVPLSGSDVLNVNYDETGGSDFTWDSTVDLNSNDGLMVFNRKLSYPSKTGGSGVTNGNFGALTNAPTNPDYSGTTGDRSYYRFFSFKPTSRVQKFVALMDFTNTIFVPETSSLSGNNVHVEFLVPNVTTILSQVGFKDAYVDYDNDETVGLFFESLINDTIYENNPAARGYQLGRKDTLPANDVVVIRITASSSWVGSIDRIELVPLT
jgi:hypothetical protein